MIPRTYIVNITFTYYTINQKVSECGLTAKVALETVLSGLTSEERACIAKTEVTEIKYTLSGINSLNS